MNEHVAGLITYSHPKQGTVQGKTTRTGTFAFFLILSKYFGGITPDINMSEPPDLESE